LLVTADHGNAELMIDPVTGGPHTAHTTNPVPFILVTDAPARTLALRPGGSLRDIAPTMLSLLGLHKPSEMTGEDLGLVVNLTQQPPPDGPKPVPA
jgi:2,3-bisphosphoglycerate-independent phosphoglycerate mutase